MATEAAEAAVTAVAFVAAAAAGFAGVICVINIAVICRAPPPPPISLICCVLSYLNIHKATENGKQKMRAGAGGSFGTGTPHCVVVVRCRASVGFASSYQSAFLRCLSVV